MNKQAYYFSHDSNARNDEKILAVRMRHKAEGYAIYFMILERLREDANGMSIKDYNVLAFDFRVQASKVKSIVEDFGLFDFTEDGKFFYSKRLKNNMNTLNNFIKKQKENGKKGGNPNFIKGKSNPYYNKDNLKDNPNITQALSQTLPYKRKGNKSNIITPLTPLEGVIPPNENFENSKKNSVGDERKTEQQTRQASFPVNAEKKEKEKSCAKKEKEKRKGLATPLFIKPTQAELADFFEQKQNGHFYSGIDPALEAEKFFNFYESKGWFVGKNKMKSWRHAAANWYCRTLEKKSKDEKPKRTYTDYSEIGSIDLYS